MAGLQNLNRAACHASPSALASIMEGVFDYWLRADKPDPALMRQTAEGEGGRQATLLQNQTQLMLDISVVAPMLGLLGTVWGMLKAFNVVAAGLAQATPLALASGVSLALITTVAGLVVAIPAMVAYAYFRGRAARLVADLEVTSARLMGDIESSSGTAAAGEDSGSGR